MKKWTKNSLVKSLYNYQSNVARLNLLKLKRDTFTTVSAVDNGQERVQTSNKNGEERKMITYVEMGEKIKELEYELKVIDYALEGIREEWRNVIKMKYVEKYTWDQIVDEVSMSKTGCERYKDKGLNAMLSMLNNI